MNCATAISAVVSVPKATRSPMSHRVFRKACTRRLSVPSGAVVHPVELRVHGIVALVRAGVYSIEPLVHLDIHGIKALDHLVEVLVQAVEVLVYLAEAHFALVCEHVQAREHLAVSRKLSGLNTLLLHGLFDLARKVGGDFLFRQPSGLAHALRKRCGHETRTRQCACRVVSLPCPAQAVPFP